MRTKLFFKLWLWTVTLIYYVPAYLFYIFKWITKALKYICDKYSNYIKYLISIKNQYKQLKKTT